MATPVIKGLMAIEDNDANRYTAKIPNWSQGLVTFPDEISRKPETPLVETSTDYVLHRALETRT